MIRKKQKQILEVWEPLKGLPTEMYLEKLIDGYNGLELFLKGDSNKRYLCLHFEDHVAYRNVDDSDRLKFSDEFSDSPSSTFFTMRHSHFVKWLCQESYEIKKESDLTHFVIVTPNDIIDVIAFTSPSLFWVENNNIA